MKNKMNVYHCAHCDKNVKRNSDKKWIKSYCDSKDRYVRLQLVKKPK